MKKTILWFIVFAFVISGITFASGSQEESKTTDHDLEFVKLRYYLPANSYPDHEKVFAKANELIKEKINAEVEFITVAWSDYPSKMQLVVASGEEYDLCYTNNWGMNDYVSNASKDAFIEITDEMLNKYAPEALPWLPEAALDAVKVNGVRYGVPLLQNYARATGVFGLQSLRDEFSFDSDSVESLDDLTPWFEKIHASYPQMTVLEVVQNPYLIKHYPFMKFDTIAGDVIPGAISWDESKDNFKVVNQFASEEFLDYLKIKHKWYKAGYIRKDAATITDPEPERRSGNVACAFSGTYMPGFKSSNDVRFGNRDTFDFQMGEALVTTGNILATVTGISVSSQNPERALMLYNLLMSDSELLKLLTYGIEGEHYEVLADGTIRKAEDSQYGEGIYAWQIGNQFIDYVLEGQPSNVWEMHAEYTENARPSPLMGFSVNLEPLQSELAKLTAVSDQYLSPLCAGLIPPEELLPEFLEKLDAAGAQTVIDELQSQVDAWRASSR